MDGEKSGERGGDAKEEGESLGKVTSLLHYLSLSVFGNCISHILKEYFCHKIESFLYKECLIMKIERKQSVIPFLKLIKAL